VLQSHTLLVRQTAEIPTLDDLYTCKHYNDDNVGYKLSDTSNLSTLSAGI